MKVGDLVRTPGVLPMGRSPMGMHNFGIPGFFEPSYGWEDRIAVVVGFDTRPDSGDNFIKVRIQETGQLCVFSADTLRLV